MYFDSERIISLINPVPEASYETEYMYCLIRIILYFEYSSFEIHLLLTLLKL